MPSFDILSRFDVHEVGNAVDQSNRELSTRFDFKGSNASFKLVENVITLEAQNEFQIQQMQQILEPRLAKRGVMLESLERGKVQENLHEAKQEITVKFGLDQETNKTITKLIKSSGLKVQTSIMGDHIRVTGKKRDDLQDVINLLKKEPLNIPLQYENFRD